MGLPPYQGASFGVLRAQGFFSSDSQTLFGIGQQMQARGRINKNSSRAHCAFLLQSCCSSYIFDSLAMSIACA
jgi:hypothetical protein